MSKPSRLFVILALLALGGVCGSHFYNPAVAQEKAKAKGELFRIVKWEYRIVVMYDGTKEEDGQKELNKLGDEGFELVSQSSSTSPNKQPSRIHYTLKRAK